MHLKLIWFLEGVGASLEPEEKRARHLDHTGHEFFKHVKNRIVHSCATGQLVSQCKLTLSSNYKKWRGACLWIIQSALGVFQTASEMSVSWPSHWTRSNYISYSHAFLTSSTAQGGGGSFKNRKPIGEIGCCESGMAERSHWWTERCWISPTLSLAIYLPTHLFSMYLSIYLSIYLPIHPSIHLSIYLSIYRSIVVVVVVVVVGVVVVGTNKDWGP